MRNPIVPNRGKPVRQKASAEQPAEILLMESISERERPVRQRKEQASLLRTVVRAALWVALLLATLGVLAWRVMVR